MTTKTGTTGDFTSAQLEAEAASVTLGQFELRDAVRLGQLVVERATAEQLPIVLEIDHGLRLAYRAALPGSRPDSDHWIAGKRRVVRRFERATLAVRVAFEERGTTFAEATGLAEDEYAAHGGGVPILVRGVGIVGAIYVSGLPQVDDHALCISSLRSLA